MLKRRLTGCEREESNGESKLIEGPCNRPDSMFPPKSGCAFSRWAVDCSPCRICGVAEFRSSPRVDVVSDLRDTCPPKSGPGTGLGINPLLRNRFLARKSHQFSIHFNVSLIPMVLCISSECTFSGERLLFSLPPGEGWGEGKKTTLTS